MADNVHKNHRERVRKEFLEQGFNMNTPKHKIIEMLLFYGIPQKDTNEIAHNLIKYFGSIEALLEADSDELKSINGIGENCVALIKLVQFIAEYYLNEKNKYKKRFENLDEICEMIVRKYLSLKKEMIAITSLDKTGKFLGFDFVGEGDIESAGVSIRDVVEIVLKRNATTVILSHNHPGGNALPSDEDIKATAKVVDSLNYLKVKLADHIIIAENDYVSLKQSYQYGYLFETVE